MKAPKAHLLVVVKRTAFDTYGKSDPIARRLLERRDVAVARILPAHEDHHATVDEVRAAIRELPVTARFARAAGDGNSRAWFPRERFDLVVTVGGDGTLLAASHHVGKTTPILGVNSAPDDSVGFFCGATRLTARRALSAAIRGTLKRTTLARMAVEINRQTVHTRVLNEALFCHASPAATSRYIVKLGPVREEHKSSGFWVGPAAGSTAAQRSAGGQVLPLSSRALQLVVREAYHPGGLPPKLAVSLVPDRSRLEVRCKMRQARLFLDGVHTMVTCGLGDVVVFRRSPESLVLLGRLRRSR